MNGLKYNAPLSKLTTNAQPILWELVSVRSGKTYRGRSLNKISTICWWIFPLVARIWFLEMLKGPPSKALTVTLIFLNQILRLEYVIVYIWPNAHKSYKRGREYATKIPHYIMRNHCRVVFSTLFTLHCRCKRWQGAALRKYKATKQSISGMVSVERMGDGH